MESTMSKKSLLEEQRLISISGLGDDGLVPHSELAENLDKPEAAAVEQNEAAVMGDKPTSDKDIKGIRYTPSQSAADILDTMTADGDLSKQDVLNIALLVLQSTNRQVFQDAFLAIMREKANALLSKLS